MARLQVVVDDDERVVAHLQKPCYAAVRGGVVIDDLLAQNGEAGVDAQVVGGRLWRVDLHRVVVRVEAVVEVGHLLLPVVVLLNAKNVGLALAQVVGQLLKGVVAVDVIDEACRVEGNNLDGIVRRWRRQVHGHIDPHGGIGDQEAYKGNQRPAPLDDEPEEQESQVSQGCKGEQQAQGAERRVVSRTYMVGKPQQ